MSKEWLLEWAKRVCTVSGAFGRQASDTTAHVSSFSRECDAACWESLKLGVEHRGSAGAGACGITGER